MGKLQIVCVNTIDYVPAVQDCFCQKVTQAWNALISLNNNNAQQRGVTLPEQPQSQDCGILNSPIIAGWGTVIMEEC